MQIQVVVFATLRKYLPDLPIGGVRWFEVEPDATIADLLPLLELPAEEVKIIVRNNLHAEWDERLVDGDRVAFIPAVGGG